MFWTNFTPKEADDYYFLIGKIGRFATHCEASRKAKVPVQEDLRPTDNEFYRWNELFWKFWA